MKQLISVLVAAIFAAASATAIAQEKKADTKKEMKTEKKAPTAAQKKRQECNAQADDKKLKGDERKKFVSGCVKPAAKKGEAKAKTESKKTETK
jgi:uncharacterized membrane protein (DUF106 family)